MNNPAAVKVISLAEVCISHSKELSQNMNHDCDSYDSKAEHDAYHKKITELQNKMGPANAEFCYERDIFEIYTRDRQIELLERITVALEKIASKEIA